MKTFISSPNMTNSEIDLRKAVTKSETIMCQLIVNLNLPLCIYCVYMYVMAPAHESETIVFNFRKLLCQTTLQPCLLMDQNEMSNLYRGPSIDASYQVSYHLAKRFQRKSCFRNRPIRNKNC
jgi:hypothetical protein